MKYIAKVIGIIALAFLALHFDSLVCGLGAVLLFCSLDDE